MGLGLCVRVCVCFGEDGEHVNGVWCACVHTCVCVCVCVCLGGRMVGMLMGFAVCEEKY